MKSAMSQKAVSCFFIHFPIKSTTLCFQVVVHLLGVQVVVHLLIFWWWFTFESSHDGLHSDLSIAFVPEARVIQFWRQENLDTLYFGVVVRSFKI